MWTSWFCGSAVLVWMLPAYLFLYAILRTYFCIRRCAFWVLYSVASSDSWYCCPWIWRGQNRRSAKLLHHRQRQRPQRRVRSQAQRKPRKKRRKQRKAPRRSQRSRWSRCHTGLMLGNMSYFQGIRKVNSFWRFKSQVRGWTWLNQGAPMGTAATSVMSWWWGMAVPAGAAHALTEDWVSNKTDIRTFGLRTHSCLSLFVQLHRQKRGVWTNFHQGWMDTPLNNLNGAREAHNQTVQPSTNRGDESKRMKPCLYMGEFNIHEHQLFWCEQHGVFIPNHLDK